MTHGTEGNEEPHFSLMLQGLEQVSEELEDEGGLPAHGREVVGRHHRVLNHQHTCQPMVVKESPTVLWRRESQYLFPDWPQ